MFFGMFLACMICIFIMHIKDQVYGGALIYAANWDEYETVSFTFCVNLTLYLR